MNFSSKLSPKPEAALLIVGHGSTENPDSSTPYFDHAAEIRKRGLFAEGHCCFWKEEPSMREALYMIDAEEVYIVPDFISEGYFTRDVIPCELELTGPKTQVHGKTLHYCDPIGIHPSMTSLILKRTEEVAPGVPPEESTLFIVGHGTGLKKTPPKRSVIRWNSFKLFLKTVSLPCKILKWKKRLSFQNGTNSRRRLMADVILDQIATFDAQHVAHTETH